MDTALAALERVFGAFEAQHRCPRDELDAAERRLQIKLPVALTTLYARTGHHPLHTAENRLVPPDKIDFDGDHLVIYEENQRVCLWGIAESALLLDDPPVDVSVMTERGIE